MTWEGRGGGGQQVGGTFTGYETIFVFRKNEGRVSRVLQFPETAEITEETSFSKQENRENKENFK